MNSKKFLWSAGVFALLLVLSGCMRSDHTVRINSDGSGSIEVTTAFDFDAFAALVVDDPVIQLEGLGTAERERICSAMWSSTDAEAIAPVEFDTLVEFEERKWCGYTGTIELPASTDHSAALEPLFEDPVLVKEGENWRFEGGVLIDNLDAIDFEAISYEELGLGPIDPPSRNDVRDNSRYTIQIRLPGEAIADRHNADTVRGGVFEWEIDMDDRPRRLLAATEPFSPPFPWARVALIAAIAGGALAAAWALFGGRKPKNNFDAAKVFARFDPDARHAVLSAEEDARVLASDRISPSHLLLGLGDPSAGKSSEALKMFGASHEGLITQMQLNSTAYGSSPKGRIPFTVPSRQAFDRATSHAKAMGHGSVGSGHLLLGVLDDPDVGSLLANIRVDRGGLAKYTKDLLTHNPSLQGPAVAIHMPAQMPAPQPQVAPMQQAPTQPIATGPAPTPQASAAPPVVAVEPHYIESIGRWVLEHPEHGRFWHDPEVNRWVPFPDGMVTKY